MLHDVPEMPLGTAVLALGMPAPEDTRAFTRLKSGLLRRLST